MNAHQHRLAKRAEKRRRAKVKLIKEEIDSTFRSYLSEVKNVTIVPNPAVQFINVKMNISKDGVTFG